MRTPFTLFFAVFIVAWLWLDARAQNGGPTVSGAQRPTLPDGASSEAIRCGDGVPMANATPLESR